MSGGNMMSRRRLVSTLGVAAAAAAVPAMAEARMTPTAQPLVDPRTKYAQPPYKVQPQDWPGLASKMDPRPDHGETSYKGSGRLLGRKALITGGDSGMGRAAALPTHAKAQMSRSTICQRRSRTPRKCSI